MPNPKSCIPLKKHNKIASEVQPGKAESVKIFTHSTYTPKATESPKSPIPIALTNRKGAMEKLVMPFHAKESIFLRLY